MASLKPVRAILLDIEGTVCPVSFVKDTLLPYFIDILNRDLDALWDNPDFARYRYSFPAEYQASATAFQEHIKYLVSRDVKAPYMKSLQGYLWKEGYRTGRLRAPLFDDVAPAILKWEAMGLSIMIYSSGSVLAQKLFFAHTTAQPPDLTALVTAWFDTVNAGPKTIGSSYANIASKFPSIRVDQWLFLSDNLAEVEAARTCGMQSLPVSRPGNGQLPEQHELSNAAVDDFGALDIVPA